MSTLPSSVMEEAPRGAFWPAAPPPAPWHRSLIPLTWLPRRGVIAEHGIRYLAQLLLLW